ncbi:uncharacterized protein B4U79_12058 [Dinothrombium tinctorium]|uniref:Uncharacterized protein n=1 Tax=Dinothrombium tinctorium TaxID=1965070 RepID=A0A3S5WGV8_9ACAR|nr:uncharacterized protein B4U79_12058 [Dinothrombium tinctorium]
MSTLSALPSPEVSVHNNPQSFFNRQLPLSPSNLSVNYLQSPGYHNGALGSNFIYPSNPSSLAPSPTRTNSIASSINDLTIETEQLERAIRHNDTRFVRRMLELYHNKFLFPRGSLFDKSSLETRSICGGIQQHDRISLCKERFERKESGSTAEPGGESPAIFTNALHLAIESNAFDVAILLLKFSFDPNEAGVTPFTSLDLWRRRSDSSYESTTAAGQNGTTNNNNNLNVYRASSFSTSREQLLPHSARSASPHLLSPVLGSSSINITKDVQHFIRFSITSSPSSVNSEISSIGRYSTPTKVIKIKSELPDRLRIVHMGSGDEAKPITYEDEYTRDTLYSLPPIFLATALNNAPILRELIKYGANVNIADRYGVTPFHLALCQERISRSCVHILLQSGAKTLAKNKQGVTPRDLLQARGDQLTELQKILVENAFAQILPQQNTLTAISNSSKQQQTQTDADDISSPSLGLLFGDSNSVSGDIVKVIHPEEENDNIDFNVLYTTKSNTSVINGNPNSATATASSSSKPIFLRKLKSNTKTRKTTSRSTQQLQQEPSSTTSGPDVYLCLEEISSDGPSHSSYQERRESLFDTCSVQNIK